MEGAWQNHQHAMQACTPILMISDVDSHMKSHEITCTWNMQPCPREPANTMALKRLSTMQEDMNSVH